MTSENISHLRGALHQAKTDLDGFAARLRTAFDRDSDDGACLYNLLKNVEKLERDVAALETDYRHVQTAKRECLNAAVDLVANWTTLQKLKVDSGLPKDDDADVAALTSTTSIVEHELVKTHPQIDEPDYLRNL